MAEPVGRNPRNAEGLAAVAAALWEGLSTPSALAFRAFLASFLATIAFCCWFFTEDVLSGPMGRYLARSSLDAEGSATHAALRAGHFPPRHPRLFVVGDSKIAQAVASGVALRDLVQKATGRDLEMVELATPLQSPTDQFALLDRALASQSADSPPALIILGTGIDQLRWNNATALKYAERPRLGLRSDWQDAEITALGGTPKVRTGFYLWDNLPFALLNGSEALFRIALRSPAVPEADQYARAVAELPQAEIRRVVGDEIRSAVRDHSEYFDQIDRLATRLERVPNTRLILIEEPLSPALIADQALEPLRDGFDIRMRTFIGGRNIAYWPIAKEAGLAVEDYFDDLHINVGAAQTRIQAAIAAHVVAMIAAEQAGGNGN